MRTNPTPRMSTYAIFGTLFSFLLASVCRGEDRTENQETLKSLVSLHRQLGLPAPQPGSKLAKTLTSYNEKHKPNYTIAFRLALSQNNAATSVLICSSIWEVRNPFEIQELPPTVSSLRLFEYSVNNNLFLAIHCKILGHEEMALILIDEIRDHGEIDLCKESLIQMASYYWYSQISEPRIDRKPVLIKLRELQKLEPTLFGPTEQKQIKWLELALQPSSAKPGSIHALIDQLVDETYRDENYHFAYGDTYWRIASMGFEAVPALIEHLEDERLTRGTLNPDFFGSQIKSIVSHMLDGLAGEYLNRGNFHSSGFVGTVLKTSAQEWWNKTKNRDEKAYFLERALLGPNKEHNGSRASEHAIRVIQAKYPEQLPVLYRLVLEKRHDLSSVELAGAIARSSLPLKEKLAYLWDGATHADIEHAEPALKALFKLDNKRSVDYLIQVINAIPA